MWKGVVLPLEILACEPYLVYKYHTPKPNQEQSPNTKHSQRNTWLKKIFLNSSKVTEALSFSFPVFNNF
jgi:hypothetical protein